MTAAIEKRLTRLEAAHAPDERRRVIVRRLGDGPWRGEVVRVSELLTGRKWMRADDESAEAFTERIETEGGPRVATNRGEA